ncbi:porin [uncultured Dechloromonas sp.]|uniref:porin n=1 Tax=uncultured Dechloromonas sp. TaxID=171719 RepID=UPI0025CDD658|nr:porin [uncultured Dechloromonas sp.]
MQKKIIALAVAALASSAAFAQTNVTIYGVADATFDSVKATGSTGNSDRLDFNSRNRVTANSSLIGFKGVEDLGNGLKAVFQFESSVSFDAATGGNANRDSFVGLAGGFGTIVAGNLTGPTRAMGAKFDVNAGATGIGANTALLGKFGGGSGAGHFDQRITNAIAYVSPTIGGFSGVAAYSTGFTTTGLAGHESMGADNNGQGNTAWTMGLNFETGPIYAGYAYTAVNAAGNGSVGASSTTTANTTTGAVSTVNVIGDGLAAGWNKVDNHRLGVMYKAAFGQVGFLFDRARLDPTTGSDLKQNTTYLSGKFNLGKGAILAQWGHAGDLKGNSVDKEGANHYVAGYEYNLSKRTMLKAVYSRINNKNNANYDYLYGVSNPNSTATVSGGLSDGAQVNGFSVGLRHSF